jgi:hypothetical protein
MLFLGLMVRHGLVAIVACLVMRNLLEEFPITADWGVWYWWAVLTPLALAALLLLLSFYASIGGRPLLSIRWADRA